MDLGISTWVIVEALLLVEIITHIYISYLFIYDHNIIYINQFIKILEILNTFYIKLIISIASIIHQSLMTVMSQ